MRKLLMALSLFSLPLLGSLRAPEKLGSLALLNTPSGFAVMKNKHITPIEPDCVDGTLRKMDFKQRTAYMLKGGGLELNQANTGEYTIKSVANLKGGGPIAGAVAYWVTKSLCWGGVTVAATAAATGIIVAGVATGGAAIGASAGAIATVTGGATAAAGIGIGAIGGGAASAVGATVAAGAIGATAAGTAAATTGVAAAGTALGAAGMVAGIESAAIAAGAAFTFMPWLP